MFTIALIGGLLTLFLGDEYRYLMPLFILITKFGGIGAFTTCYLATVEVFPTLFASSAMGFCNFFARLITTFAPLLAETEPPMPMIILCTLSMVAIIATQFIR